MIDKKNLKLAFLAFVGISIFCFFVPAFVMWGWQWENVGFAFRFAIALGITGALSVLIIPKIME